MNTIRITSLCSIIVGIMSILVSVELRGNSLASSFSFGYTTLSLGLVSFVIDLFKTRKMKAQALMIAGMILVVFGEKIPSLFILALTKKEGVTTFLDFAASFMILGIACVAFSLFILVLESDSDEKKNEPNN